MKRKTTSKAPVARFVRLADIKYTCPTCGILSYLFSGLMLRFLTYVKYPNHYFYHCTSFKFKLNTTCSNICLLPGMRGRVDDEGRGIMWYGCDKDQCGRWYHETCLAAQERDFLNESLEDGGSWYCKRCKPWLYGEEKFLETTYARTYTHAHPHTFITFD